MKPRISILHYTALPVIGGVENVTAEHTRLLTSAGYQVEILAGRGGDSPALAGATIVSIPEIDSEYPENQEIASALDRGEVLPQFQALQARIERMLLRHLTGSDILVVHNALTTHFNMPLTAALYHMLDAGSLPPCIAWVHDISRYVNPQSGFEQRHGFPWDLLRMYRPEIKYAAVSSRRRDMLAATFACPPDRIAIVPNGVDPDTLLSLTEWSRHLIKEFRLLEADLILLMPVRVTRAKNVEFALATVAALKQAGQNVRLIISGPPDPHSQDSQDYFQNLLAQRHGLGLDNEAIFLYEGFPGFPGPLVVGLARVAELYRLADVILMPSWREGFGLPVIEAGLTRQAVFSTRVPAVDTVGADAVNVIADGESPEHVAARMIEWAKADSAQRLRQRVRQRFTWQAIFERDIQPILAGCLRRAKEQA